MGVVLTHVAFQTGTSGGVVGRLLHRFDLAVAVFFALSGFLLWRGHAAAARRLRHRPATGHYLRSRLVRIMPGYLFAVVVILTLLPEANHASPTVWLANLTLTQVYVPLTLTAGLTQMWSLSVEVSFYLALPILAALAYRLPVRARVPVITVELKNARQVSRTEIQAIWRDLLKWIDLRLLPSFAAQVAPAAPAAPTAPAVPALLLHSGGLDSL